MGASYSGLYEEGEVEHINVPPYTLPLMIKYLYLECLGLTIKKTELEVGKAGYYRQGGARAQLRQLQGAHTSAKRSIMQ